MTFASKAINRAVLAAKASTDSSVLCYLLFVFITWKRMLVINRKLVIRSLLALLQLTTAHLSLLLS